MKKNTVLGILFGVLLFLLAADRKKKSRKRTTTYPSKK